MAIILGALAVGAVWFLPPLALKLLVLAIIAAGSAEYAGIFIGDRWVRAATLLASLVLSSGLLFCSQGPAVASLLLPVCLFLLSMLVMVRSRDFTKSSAELAQALFCLVYLALSFSFWGLLRDFGQGREFILLALVPACLSDTMALIAGKCFGQMMSRKKFAPRVSPNKTWEGFIGALFGSLLGVVMVRELVLPNFSLSATIALALIIWIVAPMGDLVESMLKRSRGMKDSGQIIPGHGGVLDRLDALIFVAPAMYLFLKYVLSVQP